MRTHPRHRSLSRAFAAIIVMLTSLGIVETAAKATASSSLGLLSVNPSWTNTDVTAIGAGNDHNCAIESGSVYCWGRVWPGLLGTGVTTDAGATAAAPVLVAAADGFTNRNVTALSVGASHACAIESGSVYCWGSNESGRLGVDPGTQSSWGPQSCVGQFATLPCSSSPVKVRAAADNSFTNTTVTAVVAGGSHTCAIEGKKAYCWGKNGNDGYSPASIGRLGDGTENPQSRPIPVSSNAGFTNSNVLDITAGDSHTCAIQGANASATTGVAYCWGQNWLAGSPSSSPHRGGLLGAGAIGEMFTGQGTKLPNPVSSGDFPSANQLVSRVWTRSNHTCALDSGSVVCWGSGRAGDLTFQGGGGLGNNDATMASKPLPTMVTSSTAPNMRNIGAVLSVATGAWHSCAIEGATPSATNGVLHCWGANKGSQLGVGNAENALVPTAVLTSTQPGFANTAVTSVAAGRDHTCAIEAKIAYCWGDDTYRKLGFGSQAIARDRPLKVATAPTVPGAPSIQSISARSGQLDVNFNPPQSDGGSLLTNYEYSIDGGTTFVPRSPASVFGPIIITGLTNGTAYSIVIRAVNAVGAGASSTAVSGTPSDPMGGGGSSAPTPTIDSATTDGTKISVKVSGVVPNAQLRVWVYDSAYNAADPSSNTFAYQPSFPNASISGGVATFEITQYFRSVPPNTPTLISISPTETYRIKVMQADSSGAMSAETALFNVTLPGEQGSSGDPDDSNSGSGAAASGSPTAPPSTAAATTTTVADVFANAVPGITKTDTTVYTKPPANVAADSAINVLTRAQNKVMDIQTKTPSVCLPNDDELVFVDEGRCIADVVNTKTRAVLRTLRTTVVEDDITELKVGNAIVTLAPIYFDTMSATLDTKAMNRVKALKSRVSAAGSVLIVGHSGTLNGNSPENVAISQARAESTLKALKSIGAKGPFAVSGVGALDPARTGKTQAAQAKNRRVVIVLVP